MTAGEYFSLVEDLPVGTWRDVTGGKPFAVLAPHPDDESLGTGGLIALARRHGCDATVILLTDGSRSHPSSTAFPRERVIATRRAELARAGLILGLAPDNLFALGLPDSEAPTTGPAFDCAVERVGEILSLTGAQTLFVTWQHDPHCDHQAAACLAQEIRRRNALLTLWAYPVWGWHLAASQSVDAPPPAGFRLEVADVLHQKHAAIQAHVSQMTDLISDDPSGFRMTAEMCAPFLGRYEYYLEIPPS